MNKNAGTKWFLKSDTKIDNVPIQQVMNEFHMWVNAQDGLVGRYTRFFNEHSFETVDIFTNEETGKDFIQKRDAHETFQEQQIYYEEHQITVNETIY